MISSKSAIAQWLKLQYYRELVPLIEQGSPQPLDKTLALLGPHKGVLWGGGEILWNFKFLGVSAHKNLLTGTVPANKSLLTGTVPANKSLLTGTVFRSITSSLEKWS